MKKLLLLLIVVSFSSVAQEIGIKAGPSLTVSNGTLKDDYGKGKLSFNAGAFVRDDLGKANFVFEVFYNQVNLGSDFRLHTGNAAFLLESKGRLAVQVGPTASFRLSHKQKQLEAYQGSILPVNVDATAGLLFRVSERVGLNARYTYSLFESIEDSKYHPMGVTFSVNYMIKRF